MCFYLWYLHLDKSLMLNSNKHELSTLQALLHKMVIFWYIVKIEFKLFIYVFDYVHSKLW